MMIDSLLLIICLTIIPFTIAFQSSPCSPKTRFVTSYPKNRNLQLTQSLLVVDIPNAVSTVDSFFKSSPYEAAFITCGIKASAADLLAQKRELVKDACGEEIHNAAFDKKIDPERNLAFILYGGLYQGITQYYIYNILFPSWFGAGNDISSVAIKVAFDMFVISPLLCLPIAYLTKSVIYGQSWKDGLAKYKYDLVENNLLQTYCSIWIPVQALTFGVVPEHLRIAFIAFVSFFWLIILSTVSSSEMKK